MILLILLFLATIILAYSNGANDNFKGVATLYGSGTTHYKGAIGWATATTFLGSLFSIVLAQKLISSFSGKQLVPDAVTTSPQFLLAVAAGAAITVILATQLGFPISTTHSLTGALVGGGLMAVGTQVNFVVLGNKFFLPLLFSPLIAVVLAGLAYVVFRAFRLKLGITRDVCLCVRETEELLPVAQPNSVLALKSSLVLETRLDMEENCVQRYNGRVLGINAQSALDFAHYLSAGMVSFARGLSDTPKIVALLLVIRAIGLDWGMFAVAMGMAIGGLLNARKVAHTMSKRITPLNHGQGFTANLVTSLLVVFASKWGMPVSTTHVSVGSLFGIGLTTREANKKVVSQILMSWILTLPIALVCSAAIYMLLNLL